MKKILYLPNVKDEINMRLFADKALISTHELLKSTIMNIKQLETSKAKLEQEILASITNFCETYSVNVSNIRYYYKEGLGTDKKRPSSVELDIEL